ncbi:MAG: phage holin family protein [Novosphingobium sp.]
MADDSPEPVSKDATVRSLIADVRQLAEDGRTLVEAELAYHKSRALLAGQTAKSIAGWGALALALVFLALLALVFGLVLALVPVLGALGATAVMVLALLACALLCAWTASLRWKRAAAQIADEGPGQ